ncbi:MAG: hypothetical protein HFE59_04990 [Clostridiales bacterium]|nr:hypothetical protein [Clostridiales bacterium]
MAVKNKNGMVKLLFILIIITCIVIIAAVSWKSGSDAIYGDFENTKKSAAEVLYSDVSGADLEKDYPKTPDEVIQFYGKCYKLIYGDMIRNDDIFANVLHIQRRLYSKELAEKNLFEVQLEQIKSDVEALKDSNVVVIDFEAKPPIYSKDFKTCEVRTIISTNANDENGTLKAYWVYNIVKDEKDLWKIHSFRRTDSDFN